MPDIRVRPKHQVTLPASIVREAKLVTDDRLHVAYVNGNIVLTPHKHAQQKDDLMSYAGIFRGAWGKTAKEVDKTLGRLRKEWE